MRESYAFPRRLSTRREMSRSLREISLAIRRSSSLTIIQERHHYTRARALGRWAQFLLRGAQSDRFMLRAMPLALRSQHFVSHVRYLREYFTRNELRSPTAIVDNEYEENLKRKSLYCKFYHDLNNISVLLFELCNLLELERALHLRL